MRELRDRTVGLVTRLVDDAPHVNIALKPHPNENVVFWADFVSQLGRPQVRLVVGEPINHLLRLSDLHVAFNVCTTTVEALLVGVPTIELQTTRSRNLYGEPHLNLPNYRALAYEDVAEAVRAELSDAPLGKHRDSSQQAKLSAYVEQYLHAFDGRRCEAYAEAIAGWARTLQPAARGWRVFVKQPGLASLLGVVRAKAVASRLLHPSSAADPISQVNRPQAENSRATRTINGVLVDQEFGLFDNRMRVGDERVWLDTYAATLGPGEGRSP